MGHLAACAECRSSPPATPEDAEGFQLRYGLAFVAVAAGFGLRARR